MKIERIKKNHKKEIVIGGLILVSIVSAITLVTTRAKYRVTQDIKLARGTVNYKPYDFKIMAMYQENDSGTYTEINTMPASGYVVNEEKSYCITDNKNQVKGKIKTIDGNHIISNLQKKDKCYIWFDKKNTEIVTKILGNIEVQLSSPNFTNAATTDEGVFKISDGMYGGTSYYYRGAVENNYVKFAGFCWRIIRINGDGSIRLIYDGTTCHANGTSTTESIAVAKVAYNSSSSRSEYVGWTYTTGSQRGDATESNIKKQTESWFNSNITGANLDKVADGYFCNDRDVVSGSSWSSQPAYGVLNYSAYNRSNPTLDCPSEDKYTLKIGAITTDEAQLAGGIRAGENTFYYLYNGQYYWTMTPFRWAPKSVTGSVSYVEGFYIYNNGSISTNLVTTNFSNIRPVINLKASTRFFMGGTGEIDTPYEVA